VRGALEEAVGVQVVGAAGLEAERRRPLDVAHRDRSRGVAGLVDRRDPHLRQIGLTEHHRRERAVPRGRAASQLAASALLHQNQAGLGDGADRALDLGARQTHGFLCPPGGTRIRHRVGHVDGRRPGRLGVEA
jgi:hypothetical protein